MWKIGNLKIDGRVVLGPMSGFTSSGYREFMKPFGIAVSMTEMTSGAGIINGFGKTMVYVDFGPNFPTGLQLFGNDPNLLAHAAEVALEKNPNIDFFDINMGCPVNKVTRNGSGSSLMNNPEKCGEIVREIKKKVDVPVTAKIRLGQDLEHINFKEVIEKLTDADVDAITVHARVRDERYTGFPHYDMVEGLQSEMSVPLIISGNIYSVDDASKAVESTGATAVMVARGGVGNPYLVTQIDRYFRTGELLPNPIISQQMDWCLELAEKIIAERNEDAAMRRLRSIAPKFAAGCHRCKTYRRRLATEILDHNSLIELLDEIKTKIGNEQIYCDGHVFNNDCQFD